VSTPLEVACGVQVGAVGAPVNAIDGLGRVLGAAHMCSPLASSATLDAPSHVEVVEMDSRTLAQLAPSACPHEHGLHVNVPV
jgi:hypothetical protein